MNNRAIRTALFKAGLKQYELAEILGRSESSVSMMLRYELSREEQRRIVKLIKDYEVRHEEDQNN